MKKEGVLFFLEVPLLQRVLIIVLEKLRSKDFNRKKHSYRKLYLSILHNSKQNGIELKDKKNKPLACYAVLILCLNGKRITDGSIKYVYSYQAFDMQMLVLKE